MTVCKRVYYTGRVQGVGFRYTTRGLADDFAVTGYVKNLPNGQVEVVAQGAPDQVDAFLTAIGGRMARFIERVTVQEETPGAYLDFHVRF